MAEAKVPRDNTPNRRTGRKVLPAIASVALLVAASCGSDKDDEVTVDSRATSPSSTETSGVPSTEATTEVPRVQPEIGRVVLDRSNFCHWSPENPQPLVAEGKIQVDGRCGFPMPESGLPQDDVPIGVYRNPQQIHEDLAYTVQDTETVEVVCHTEGQLIEDGVGVELPYWVLINPEDSDREHGLIPDAWTGYSGAAITDPCTQDQLALTSPQ